MNLIGLLIVVMVSFFQPVTLGEQLIEKGSITHIEIQDIVPTMKWMWDHTDGYEWIGCLHGEMLGDTLNIFAVELGDIVMSSPMRVEGSCRITKSYVGYIHGHTSMAFPNPDAPPPFLKFPGACQPSDVDLNTFMESKETAFLIIHCARNMFYVDEGKVDVKNIP